MTELNKYLGLVICLILVLITNTIGHFFPPFDLLALPLSIIGISLIINFLTVKFHPICQTIFTFCFISINDIGIKLFSGATHDLEGQGLINLSLLIGLIPAIGIFMTFIIKRKDYPILIRIISICLMIGLLYLHFHFFDWLGVDSRYLKK